MLYIMGIYWCANVFYIGNPSTHIVGFWFCLHINQISECVSKVSTIPSQNWCTGVCEYKNLLKYHGAPLKSRPGLYKKCSYYLTDVLVDLQLYN